MNLEDLAALLEDHLKPYARDVTRFAGTGYSFEDWINWEMFRAFAVQGFKCFPKPSYKKNFFLTGANALGDILVHTEVDGSWLIETSLVHGYTQDKWRKKIIADREKLLRAKGDDLKRVQLVVLCSDCEQNLQEVWAYWFKEIHYWGVPDAQRCFSDDENGEVCLFFWEVR